LRPLQLQRLRHALDHIPQRLESPLSHRATGTSARRIATTGLSARATATGKGQINDFLVTSGFDYRSNTGATLGYTSVIGSSLAVDVRGAWSRFGEWRDNADSFDPASLGFSSNAVAVG